MRLLRTSPLYPLAAFYALVCSSSAAAHSRFDVVVAFGDSWLDNGNGTWAQTNHTIPGDPAFWEGRFSNGPTWVEGLTGLLGAKQLLDYAHGGATMNNSIAVGHPGVSATIVSPAVTDQVAAFLGATPHAVTPDHTLCVLVAGGNDAFFGGANLSVRAVTDSLVRNVELLAAHGFRHFLLPSSNPIALEPYFALYGAIPGLHTFSAAFGAGVRASLRTAELPKHVDVKLWDIRVDMARILDKARERGWVTDRPCLSGAWGETPDRTLCADPERHVFFDVFHPTKVAHRALAKSAAALFTSGVHDDL